MSSVGWGERERLVLLRVHQSPGVHFFRQTAVPPPSEQVWASWELTINRKRMRRRHTDTAIEPKEGKTGHQGTQAALPGQHSAGSGRREALAIYLFPQAQHCFPSALSADHSGYPAPVQHACPYTCLSVILHPLPTDLLLVQLLNTGSIPRKDQTHLR